MPLLVAPCTNFLSTMFYQYFSGWCVCLPRTFCSVAEEMLARLNVRTPNGHSNICTALLVPEAGLGRHCRCGYSRNIENANDRTTTSASISRWCSKLAIGLKLFPASNGHAGDGFNWHTRKSSYISVPSYLVLSNCI